MLALADLILPDIKHMHSLKHLKLVGQKNDNTFSTLAYLEQIQKPYRLRYVLVPGYSDDPEDIAELGKYVSKREKMGRKYPLDGLAAATREDLDKAKAILDQYTDKVFLRG